MTNLFPGIDLDDLIYGECELTVSERYPLRVLIERVTHHAMPRGFCFPFFPPPERGRERGSSSPGRPPGRGVSFLG